MITVLSGLLFLAAAYGIYRFAKSRGVFDDTQTPGTRPGVPGDPPHPK